MIPSTNVLFSKTRAVFLSMAIIARFLIAKKFIITLVISLSDVYIANTIKNAAVRTTGLAVMTGNLLILANSF